MKKNSYLKVHDQEILNNIKKSDGFLRYKRLPKFPSSFSTPNNLKGLYTTLRIIIGFFLLIILSPKLFSLISYWSLIFIYLFIGVYGYKIVALQHDLSHNMLFKGKKLNYFVGNICSMIVGNDFLKNIKDHYKHHIRLGNEDDPIFPQYNFNLKVNNYSFFLYLLKTITGFESIKFIINTYFKTPKKRYLPYENKKSITFNYNLRTCFRIIFIILFQLLICCLITDFGEFIFLAPIPILSIVTLSILISRIRSFVEHTSFTSTNDKNFCRSHESNFFTRFLIFECGTNYHLEHHLYPNVPYYNLPKIRRVLKKFEYFPKHSLSKSLYATFKHYFFFFLSYNKLNRDVR